MVISFSLDSNPMSVSGYVIEDDHVQALCPSSFRLARSRFSSPYSAANPTLNPAVSITLQIRHNITCWHQLQVIF